MSVLAFLRLPDRQHGCLQGHARRSPGSPPTCRTRCSGIPVMHSFAQPRRLDHDLDEENRAANMKSSSTSTTTYFPASSCCSALSDRRRSCCYSGVQAMTGYHHRCPGHVPRHAEQLLRPIQRLTASTRPTRIRDRGAGPECRAARRGARSSSRRRTLRLPRLRQRDLRVRRRDLRLRAVGATGPTTTSPCTSTGPDRRARRHHRRGRVDAGQARRALLRPDRGACWSTARPALGHARSLRSQMGIVPQEGFLFSGTISEPSPSGADAPSGREVRAARAFSAPTASSKGSGQLRPAHQRHGVQLSAASASPSPSPRASSPTRASSSSTRPPPTSTSTPVANRSGLRRLLGRPHGDRHRHRLHDQSTPGQIVVLRARPGAWTRLALPSSSPSRPARRLHEDWREQAAA